MKCTQCGNTKFIQRDFLTKARELNEYEKNNENYVLNGSAYKVDDTAQVFGYQLVIRGDADGAMRIVGNCDAFVCEECGHIELFAKSLVEKIHKSQLIDEENAKRKVIEEEQLKKDYIDLNEFVNRLKTQLCELEKLKDDDNITVKEQKEVLRKLELMKQYLPICEKLVASWNRDRIGSQKIWLNIKAKQEIF